jgi:hypothetical protein
VEPRRGPRSVEIYGRILLYANIEIYIIPCEPPLRCVAGGVRTPGMLGKGNGKRKGKKGKGVLEWGFRREYTPTVIEPMADIIIKFEGIINLLQSIKSNKSPGPVEIPACVLKKLAPQMALFLEIIFTKSANEGKVPQDWQIEKVTLIFTNGNRRDRGNYRPISLTSLSCKILEQIIVSNIMTHLDKNDFLHKSQHGFRKFRSCETQLALFLHDILTSGESKKQVDAVFLDFKKPFDKVPHNKLI